MSVEAIFIKLLNMSISASWLILAVVLLRFILKRAPKSIRCILWVLVAIRLVCPFSFESFFSLIPSAETVSPDILYAETPEIHSGISAFNTYVNPKISESLAPTAVNSVNPMQVVAFIASVIWIFGMALMMLYGVISYARLRRKLAEAVPLRDNLWQSEAVACPFVLGLFRPRIYLPFGMDGESMDYVVAHENAHISRRDHWIKPIGFLLLIIYWFNPLIWLAYILLCRDIELASDEHVVKQMGAGDKKAYSIALLTCSVDRRSIAACPLAFGEVGVKQRIKNVLNYKKPAFWVIAVALTACVAVAVCFLTNPKSSGGPAKANDENDGKPIWFTVGDALGLHELKPSTQVTVYSSKSCIYMNPLSSYFPANGDSGYRYLIGKDSFAIVDKETGETAETFTDIDWNWQAVSEDEWQGMFKISIKVPDISSYDKPKMLQLSDRYFLFDMDGVFWLGQNNGGKVGMWSIYELTPGETPAVVWDFTPAISSRYPAFPFHFDMQYTRIEAECSAGNLIGFDDHNGTAYPQGKTLTVPSGSALYWSPLVKDEYSGTYALSAKITFTVYDGEDAVYTGVLSITGTAKADGLDATYSAILIDCDGLYMQQASGSEGAVLRTEH
jgi:beta-lactamase regulating signal transducer with metallopeptidase domain